MVLHSHPATLHPRLEVERLADPISQLTRDCFAYVELLLSAGNDINRAGCARFSRDSETPEVNI